MKKYEEPKIELRLYEYVDIIMTSGDDPYEDDWFNDLEGEGI